MRHDEVHTEKGNLAVPGSIKKISRKKLVALAVRALIR